ncbi:hypothetical protein ACQP1V_36410 [Microtetraspora malaysiensis]|uniref:hypothetical protein n=1 Tax=Microtetraspora malaysiensis TaxID=161358 RepID=UPI003D8D1F54
MPSSQQQDREAPRRPLSDFISAHVVSKDISYKALAARSEDPVTGQQVTDQWIRDVASGRLRRTPDLWRLRALAAGLGVDLDEIRARAIQQYLDYEVATVQTGDAEWVTVSVPPSLTPEERRRVAEMASEIARMMDKPQRDGQ